MTESAENIDIEKVVEKIAEPVHETNGNNRKLVRINTVALAVMVILLGLGAWAVIDARFNDRDQTRAIQDLADSNRDQATTIKRQAIALEALEEIGNNQGEFTGLFRQLLIAFARGDKATQQRLARQLEEQQRNAETRAQGRGTSGPAPTAPGPAGPQGPQGGQGDPGSSGGGTTTTTTTTQPPPGGPVTSLCRQAGINVPVVCEET